MTHPKSTINSKQNKLEKPISRHIVKLKIKEIKDSLESSKTIIPHTQEILSEINS